MSLLQTGFTPDPDRIVPDVAETAVHTLYENLRATLWQVDPRDEPLALCFCALVLRLDPYASARRVATALPVGGRFGVLELCNAMANLGYRSARITGRLSTLDPRLSPALILTGRDAAAEHPAAPEIRWAGDIVSATLDMRFEGSQAKAGIPPIARDGTAYLFQRIDEDRLPTSSARRKHSGKGWFRVVLQRFTPQLAQILVIGGCLNLLSLAVPLLIMLIYERALEPRVAGLMTHLAIGAGCLILAEIALRVARSRLVLWLGARLDYLVGVEIFERLLRLPAALVQQAQVSDQVARIKTFESIRDVFCGPVLMTALELPAAILAMLALYLIAGPLVLVPVIACTLLAMTFWLIWRRVRVQIREAAVEASVMQQFSLETFEKLDAIRLDGLSYLWASKYREISGRELTAQLRLARLGNIGELSGHLLVGLAALATLWVGAERIWADQMGTGALIASLMLIWRCVGPLHALCGMVPRVEQMRNAVAQVDKLMEAEAEVRSHTNALSSTRLKAHLEFSGVALRYGAGTMPLFTGLDLKIREGETVAITGPNGAGKTSILKMVLGVHQPTLGTIRVGGFDLRQLRPDDLRQQIAYVPQKIDLFEGSFADNLRCTMPLARDADLQATLELVGAWEAIAARPDGLDAPLERADFHDALLAHRIGLARAMLRPSRILLIDEMPATVLIAGLDEDLQACLRMAASDRAILFVTYRNDFLRRADRVVALRRGAPPIVGSPDKIIGMI
ncbi:peptidase domain-containing ABC transporter [Palleronia sp. LCG004]|uniref:peptidase domain-containing ABC transporter n=1 Tax=Palleronia sp. LCG004 TaxID=3079304 RepID=UPI00294243E9|nr:ATP-binding cassette domain-containing protein [Palleronia sp. LCG004]WOI56220.1 ATP-binding cassette domain-containing protein [Palleronia sp. LCG004]